MGNFSVDRVLLKAKSHLRRGEKDEARGLYLSVLEIFPGNKRAAKAIEQMEKSKHKFVETSEDEQLGHLVLLYNQGQFSLVLEKGETLREKFSKSFILWNILGAANLGLKKLEEAEVCFKRSIQLKSNFFESQNSLGAVLQSQGKLQEAVLVYKKAISLKPDYAEAYYNLGNTFQAQGKSQEAIAAYENAISIRPQYAEAYNAIGMIDYSKSNFRQAEIKLNKAISLRPDYIKPYIYLGNIFKDQGKLKEAIALYKKALSIEPKSSDARNNLGLALQDLGNLSDAILSYEGAISLEPENTEAHRNLSQIKKYVKSDKHIGQMERLLYSEYIDTKGQCNLFFALAKAYQDFGELAIAFGYLKEGNKIGKKLLSYEICQDEVIFRSLKASAKNLHKCAVRDYMDSHKIKPIFILGMPRSGTTLVEQIISSHSKIYGGGELEFLNIHGSDLALGKIKASNSKLKKIREIYLNNVSLMASNFSYITDKMPHNFQYIGLILSTFPEAKIIHVTRDPMATCWSNFKCHFTNRGLGFSYDLLDLVKFYKLYEELMMYWDDMYRESIYHLDYDILTKNLESETKKLFKYLCIEFEEKCLFPHKNKRSIRTASQQQVRKKVYAGSSENWLQYKPFLEGAFDELEYKAK